MAKKPSAADRTIDIFTGSTNVEAPTQEDIQPEVKEAEPSIEANADRWLQKAIETQQYLSKKFANSEPETETFRLTKSGDVWSLEKRGIGADGKAFSWWLVQFLDRNLYELAGVVVKAAKEKKEKENGTG